jgi:large subunit ribosomal protein L31e
MADKIEDTKFEREYIIPLRRRWKIVPTYKRANKAIKTIKEFLVKHMKIRDGDLDKIKIDKRLNEMIWSRGIKNPPSKIKVKATKEGEIVRVEAVELLDKIRFKKIREDKIKEAGKEKAKKKKEEKVVENEQENKEEGEKKVEQKEDKAAVIEAGKEIEKAEAKKAKHETKAKSPKEEKNTRTGYNQQSRGH